MSAAKRFCILNYVLFLKLDCSFVKRSFISSASFVFSVKDFTPRAINIKDSRYLSGAVRSIYCSWMRNALLLNFMIRMAPITYVRKAPWLLRE